MNGIKLFMGIAFTIFGSMFTFMMSPDAISQIQNAISISELIKGIFLFVAVNIFTVIGVVFLISMVLELNRQQELLKNGVELQCKITDIHYKKNMDSPKYFVCEYQKGNEKYAFKSDDLIGDYKIEKDGIVDVVVDPDDYTNYYIDLDSEVNQIYIHKLISHLYDNGSSLNIISAIVNGLLLGIPGIFITIKILELIYNILFVNYEKSSIIVAIVLLVIIGVWWLVTYIFTGLSLKIYKKVKRVVKKGICIPCTIIRKEVYLENAADEGLKSYLYFSFKSVNQYDFLKMQDNTELLFVDNGHDAHSKIYGSYNVGDVVNIYVIPDNPFEYVIEY